MGLGLKWRITIPDVRPPCSGPRASTTPVLPTSSKQVGAFIYFVIYLFIFFVVFFASFQCRTLLRKCRDALYGVHAVWKTRYIINIQRPRFSTPAWSRSALLGFWLSFACTPVKKLAGTHIIVSGHAVRCIHSHFCPEYLRPCLPSIKFIFRLFQRATLVHWNITTLVFNFFHSLS